MATQKVTIVGADGKLGPSVLDELLASGKFQVCVFKRASSKSKSEYPPSVRVVRVSDDFPVDEVADALKGQDALVVTITPYLTELQKRLADAAVKAGVKHFIPADFGSCDSQDKKVCELAPLYGRKADVRQHLQELSASSRHGFFWTSLVCGHFFNDDLHLKHIFLEDGRADVFGDGELRASTSTLKQIGRATAKVLELGASEKTKNRVLYIQSFCVSQNQVIAAVERAASTKLKVESIDAQKFMDKWKPKADEGDPDGAEELIWALGTLYANWEERELSNNLLGLSEEDLDEVVAGILG
ncbi:uncharacterized protein GIQ15_06319 [Arthroderma uncinatum]|uniref:uncharacterized protein n=1 Tax=Arthroderma uncinatum TaxID=74035 RepID=UPI00144ABDB7|nr:uncharacterized protein GIQ15_06319 [Arthroderma uncinatum]KAF3480972.1 hypothetical protein GIQ15_06319 [Arthroderma uncinatum]